MFVAEFDLRLALHAVLRDGAAVVAQALADPFRRRLQRELMEIPFEPAPMKIGPVRQDTEVSVVRDLRGLPALAELVREFGAAALMHFEFAHAFGPRRGKWTVRRCVGLEAP